MKLTFMNPILTKPRICPLRLEKSPKLFHYVNTTTQYNVSIIAVKCKKK